LFATYFAHIRHYSIFELAFILEQLLEIVAFGLCPNSSSNFESCPKELANYVSMWFSDCPGLFTYAAMNPDAPVTRTRLPFSIATISFNSTFLDSTSGKGKGRIFGMNPL